MVVHKESSVKCIPKRAKNLFMQQMHNSWYGFIIMELKLI